MLEAHIVSPRGSLYFSGEAHPYDLEMLWQHLHDAGYEHASDVRLELVVHDDGVDPLVTTWLRRVAANGVEVQLLLAHLPVDHDDDESRIAI